MIYDCFPFYDEYMLLEIRLNELYPYVDKFVLVEATHTFSGEPKRLYYDEVKDTKVFAPFKDKIIHLIHDVIPDSRKRQNDFDQRNAIAAGLSEAKADDLIIVSDVDEIIKPEVFSTMKDKYLPGRLQMKCYYYYFNCLSNVEWYYPAFCRFKDYHGAQFLRNKEGREYHKILIKDAGWHFSYLMSAKRIAEKIGVLSEAIFDTPYFRNEERIQRCIDSGTDLFERENIEYRIVPLDAPRYVMNNIDRFKEFIKSPETTLR